MKTRAEAAPLILSVCSLFGLWAALLLGLAVVAFVAVSDTLGAPVVECAQPLARAPRG